MSSNDAATGAPSAKEGQKKDTLSQFITDVLKQLNVSAWLPAILWVTTLALMLKLRIQGNWDIGKAVREFFEAGWPALVALFLTLLIATLITQAFSFGCIQILEGYWGTSWPMRRATSMMVRKQARHLRRLKRLHAELERRAFQTAKPALEGTVNPRHVSIIEKSLTPSDRPLAQHKRRHVEQAFRVDWRSEVAPHISRNLESLEASIADYPQDGALLPTKLGCLLYQYENQLENVTPADVQGFVLRNLDKIPDVALKQHDDYRSRLDLYCTMVFVFMFLTLAAVPLVTLGTTDARPGLSAMGFFALMSYLSYRGALASSRGYGEILLAIDSMIAPQQKRITPFFPWWNCL